MHDFLNDKYMFFYKINLKKKKKSCEKYGSTWPNPTRNPIDPNPFLTRSKWLVFYPWPVWPATRLTRPVCFAMFTYAWSQVVNTSGTSSHPKKKGGTRTLIVVGLCTFAFTSQNQSGPNVRLLHKPTFRLLHKIKLPFILFIFSMFLWLTLHAVQFQPFKL